MRRRILIYSIAYTPYIGGAEVAWKEITARLVDFEFDMVTARFSRDLPPVEKIGNITVHRVGFGFKQDKYLYPILAPFFGGFLQFQKQFGFVIGLMASYGGLAACFHKLIFPGVRYVLNMQNGDTEEVIEEKTKLIKPLYRMIFTRADRIIAISEFLYNRAKMFNPKGQLKIIPNGVDLVLFRQNQNLVRESESLKQKIGLKDKKVIISTSRLNYKNNLDSLINSLVYLPENFRLLLVGTGEDKEKLIKLASEVKVTKRVKFTGFINHKELPKYYLMADVFCRPSLQEGLGNSFLEAMAMGIPVIGTPVGGIKDFLKEGVTGLYCLPDDPESIAKAVRKITGDPELRKKITGNAAKLIKAEYSWEDIAGKYEKLFKSI